ncbi:hypothetical protein [Halovenus salina]|uniref:hypothetical protein n=1 Tax=Halovenus salina TaxID=1510225 RepID=UPI002260CD9E|nr:hypothetical protein [Halovenus salina]
MTTKGLGHLHGMTGETYPPEEKGHYRRRFEWQTLGNEWRLTLTIPKSLIQYYDARARNTRDRGPFVVDPYHEEEIAFIADEIERLSDAEGYSKREMIEMATAFVQQLPYTKNDVTAGMTQYTQYPLQTLADRGGDCEGASILLAAILREMDYGCVLLGLFDAGHMALGVKGASDLPGTYYEYGGNRYYYLETTDPSWDLGEVPPSVQDTTAEVQPVVPRPTLVYGWGTSVETGGEVTVSAAIRNVGDARAEDLSFYAALEDEGERVYADGEADLDSLDADTGTTATVTLHPPEAKRLRLSTAVLLDDDIHDFDRSEWRRPV